MRCDYCGWHNSDGVNRCVKCNQLLVDTEVDLLGQSGADLNNEKTLPLNATVTFHRDINTSALGDGENDNSDIVYCVSCGYPMPLGSRICSACGSEIEEVQHEVSNVTADMMKKTVVDATGFVATVSASEVMPNNINTKATVRDIEAKIVKSMPNDNKMTVRDVRIVQTDTPSENMQMISANSTSARMKATVRDFSETVRESNITPEALKKTVRDFGSVESVESISDVKSERVIVNEPTSIEAKFFPMENFDGKIQPIVITAESTVLNRESVDPNNMFIEEDAQASVSYEDGAWYIKNEGNTHLVYVCPNHKVKIEKDDIIVIGNRRYIFQ